MPLEILSCSRGSWCMGSCCLSAEWCIMNSADTKLDAVLKGIVCASMQNEDCSCAHCQIVLTRCRLTVVDKLSLVFKQNGIYSFLTSKNSFEQNHAYIIHNCSCGHLFFQSVLFDRTSSQSHCVSFSQLCIANSKSSIKFWQFKGYIL